MDVESEARRWAHVEFSFSALYLGATLLSTLRSRWAKRWNYHSQVDLLSLASDSWLEPRWSRVLHDTISAASLRQPEEKETPPAHSSFYTVCVNKLIKYTFL